MLDYRTISKYIKNNQEMITFILIIYSMI